jgi:TolB-like protein/DNA-binding winged helix-turn-helix (wHTH) protein
LSIGYHLGEWTVRPHRNRIERGGESIHLAPKAMAVLECLARASNTVVTRQEIFDAVWPGATISDEALTQRIAELRKAFEDSAQHSKVIETIPKIGFRLIPPVIPLEEEQVNAREFPRAGGPGRVFVWLVVAAVGLLVVVLSLSRFREGVPAVQEPSTGTERPAIAVLPFVNMSGNPGDEYFSDGISEELINLLTMVPGLDVISRTSSFSFKGGNWKMADLARELNASLVVEGTVRKIDNRVRITAQLIDPGTDKHLWAKSYDREISDIFSLQEEIAQAIVTELQDEIGTHKVIGSRPTENIEAYELFLSGRHYFYQRGAALDKAIMLLQLAVNEDPEFSEAWAYLAAAAVVTCYYQTSISNERAWLIAEQAARTSLDLDPGMGLALASQAMLAFLYEGNLARGFQLIERAAVEHPQDTTIRLWAGMHFWYCGYLEGALPHFLYAQTHDPRLGIVNGNLGLLYLALGREDLAAPRLAKATELGYPNHHHAEASLLMRRGDFDAAFAKLKVALVDPAADPDPLPWIYELEEAGRAYVENPVSADALVSVVDRAPAGGATEKAALALLFDLKDPFFEYLSISVDEGPLWLPYLVPTLWLSDYRAYIEDPRFFETMRRVGAVEVWEQRGYLDGCIHVNDPTGDHLDCSMR